MERKAVLGLIGVGYLAQKQHLPNMVRLPNIRLKWLCDLDEKLLDTFGNRYAISERTTEYRRLLEDPEVQGVVIATKEDIQARITLDALNAGKHVYVEKPLANTEEECRQVWEAQKKTGRIVMVGFNRRFAPAYVKARELLQKQGGAFNIHYRLTDACHAKKYENKGSKPRFWEREPGTRVIYELCHIFDIIAWLSGSEVESVYCASCRPDDEVYALRMASGCIATLMHSGYAATEFPKERLEAVAGTGALTVDQFVELRTFGFEGESPVYRFAGHTHPSYSEYMHKYLFEELGVEAMYAMRRIDRRVRERISQVIADINTLPELSLDRQAMEEDIKAEFPDKEELIDYWFKLVAFTEYRYDKGWMHAMNAFAVGILQGKAPADGASAEDGLRASRVGHAAIESREKNIVVNL